MPNLFNSFERLRVFSPICPLVSTRVPSISKITPRICLPLTKSIGDRLPFLCGFQARGLFLCQLTIERSKFIPSELNFCRDRPRGLHFSTLHFSEFRISESREKTQAREKGSYYRKQNDPQDVMAGNAEVKKAP